MYPRGMPVAYAYLNVCVCVRHDSSIYLTRLIHTCDMTTSHDMTTSYHMTNWCKWHDSFACRDMCRCVMWNIHLIHTSRTRASMTWSVEVSCTFLFCSAASAWMFALTADSTNFCCKDVYNYQLCMYKYTRIYVRIYVYTHVQTCAQKIFNDWHQIIQRLFNEDNSTREREEMIQREIIQRRLLRLFNDWHKKCSTTTYIHTHTHK